MARQPALAVDRQGVLHLVWSGGAAGEILYIRAKVAEAGGMGGWSTPLSLPMPTVVGSWPQIAVDSTGGLLAAYAVPLNEERGIYVTRSSDEGETWTPAHVVFDAEEAGWAIVDRPSLAASDDGSLHIAWVKAAPPDTWRPQGIYYALSRDGTAWTEPIWVAGPGSQWPRVSAGAGIVHLIYTASDGGAWHRVAPVDRADEMAGWSVPARVQGFERVEGPLGVTSGGGGILHLLGGSEDADGLVHSSWDGERWVAQSGLPLGPSVDGVLGAAGAFQAGGRLLAVAARTVFESEGVTTAAILVSQREIGGQGEPDIATPSPTATAAKGAEPPAAVGTTEAAVEATAMPSATPDLSSGPDGPTSPYGPLLVGGGLAAVAVCGLLAVRSLRSRRRR